MSIKLCQLRIFFLGVGIESYDMLQFQMLNCETAKISPDCGFNIHVTNLFSSYRFGVTPI